MGWYFGVMGQPCSMMLNTLELAEAFELFDRNCDGSIEVTEVKSVMLEIMTAMGQTVLPGAVDAVMHKFPSRYVDRHSFSKVYVEARRDAGLPWMDEFMDAFKAFDKDGNVQLDIEETLALFKETSPVAVPEEEVREIFKKIDTSGDGLIDDREFVAHLTNVWISNFAGGSS